MNKTCDCAKNKEPYLGQIWRKINNLTNLSFFNNIWLYLKQRLLLTVAYLLVTHNISFMNWSICMAPLWESIKCIDNRDYSRYLLF